MFGIFTLLFLLSGLLLIIRLIRPQIFQKVTRVIPTRKLVAMIFVGAIFVSFIGMVITAPPVEENKINNKKTIEDVNQNKNPIDTSIDTANSVVTNTIAQAEVIQDDVGQENKQITTTNQQLVIPSNQNPPTLYSVTSVVDGDTLKVNIDGIVKTIRLIGINTPEVVDPRTTVQCFGKEASIQAKALLTGKRVRLESDPTQGDLDKYSRLLRYVYLEDGTFFNKKMISDGYAYEYTYNIPYKYQAEFKAAQADAQKNLRGLWSPATCNGGLNTSTTQTVIAETKTTQSTTVTPQPSGKYYTSSYYTSKYYYPEACEAWKGLSTKYLKSFDTLDVLLKIYPNKTLSPQCQ